MLKFLLIATVFAVLQNVLGVAWRWRLVSIRFGVLAVVTLTGGPASLAFAPLSRRRRAAAASVAVAVAMAGIVSVRNHRQSAGHLLINRHHLHGPRGADAGGRRWHRSMPRMRGADAGDGRRRRRRRRGLAAPEERRSRCCSRCGGHVRECGVRGADFTLARVYLRRCWSRLEPQYRRPFRLFRALASHAGHYGCHRVVAVPLVGAHDCGCGSSPGLALPLVIGLILQVVMISPARCSCSGAWGGLEAAVMTGGFTRLHARHHAKRDGGDARAGGAIWCRAARVPGRAGWGSVLLDFLNAIIITTDHLLQ